MDISIKQIIMYLLVVVLLFSLVSSFVSATTEIKIKNVVEQSYNLGETVSQKIEFVNSEETQAVISADLVCDGNHFEFFRSIFSKSELVQTITIPQISLNEDFIGECYVQASMINTKGDVLVDDKTETFSVTNEIIFDVDAEPKSVKPGQIINIKGTVQKGEYTLAVSLDDKQTKYNINNEIISFQYTIPTEIRPGKLPLIFELNDTKGNKGNQKINIEIIQLPTRIEIEPISDITPPKKIEITATLYDQADDEMNENLNVEIKSADNKIIMNYSFVSGDSIDASFDYNVLPGLYVAEVSGVGLLNSTTFNVKFVSKADIELNGNNLTVVNKGNIPYQNNISVKAFGSENYSINFEVSVPVSETQYFDLGKKLPTQSYDIVLSSQDFEQTYSKVNILDNRNLPIKIGQGLMPITGAFGVNTDAGSFIVFVLLILTLTFVVIITVYHRQLGSTLQNEIRTHSETQRDYTKHLQSSLLQQQTRYNKIKKVMEQHVDKNILTGQLRDGNTGMSRREITVLFTDMRNFSTLFDKMSDADVVPMLNEYFSSSSKVIRENGGMINKFIGDSVMALFNAVKPQSDHMLQAVKAALEIQKRLQNIDKTLQSKGYPPLKVGIGIDCGLASVGYLGSEDKLEYTAIGVPVNTAFRMQSFAEANQVIITENMYERIKNKIDAKYAGQETLKNIKTPVKMYLVLGVRRENNAPSRI